MSTCEQYICAWCVWEVRPPLGVAGELAARRLKIIGAGLSRYFRPATVGCGSKPAYRDALSPSDLCSPTFITH